MDILKKLIGVLALAVVANVSFADSPVWGTYKVECPANSDTYIGITTTRAPVFTGKVQAIQSGTTNIVAQGEPNWSVNQFVYVAGSQTDHYYLKFTSGELEGAWYDIKSNSSSDVEIEIGSAELAKIGVNDTFQIIPHWTLATLFPDGGGFTKSTKIASGTGASVIHKYTKFDNGMVYAPGEKRAPLDSYYYRERGSVKSWLNKNKVDASNEVIEPNVFLKVVQPESDSAVITHSGCIAMCATSFEVFTMEDEGVVNNQDIYIAVPSAVDIKLSDLTSCLVDSGIFASSTAVVSKPVDTLFVYSNNNVGKNLVADETCYYRQRGSTKTWLNADKKDASNITLKAFTTIKIRKNAGTDAVSYRCKFYPTYISK